jgi:hypothetical protein
MHSSCLRYFVEPTQQTLLGHVCPHVCPSQYIGKVNGSCKFGENQDVPRLGGGCNVLLRRRSVPNHDFIPNFVCDVFGAKIADKG